MERWLVVSNCQTYGLANCLQAQLDDVEIVGVDILTYNENVDQYNRDLCSFSKLLKASNVESSIPAAKFETVPEHVTFPMLTCRVFHPDIIYLQHDGRNILGPMDDYQSAIAFAAFSAGLSVEETKKLYRGDIYEECGYMDLWPAERDRLVNIMRDFELDLARQVRQWGRAQAFMYSLNHPRIHVLYDMATAILHKMGRIPNTDGVAPHDNLAAASCFPIYPEVGEALGVKGNYRFKVLGSYKHFDLDEFLRGSFATFDKYSESSVEIMDGFQDIFSKVKSVILSN